jgi:hypothetical protein
MVVVKRRPSHLYVRIYKIFALYIKGEFSSRVYKLMFQIEFVNSYVFHVKKNLVNYCRALHILSVIRRTLAASVAQISAFKARIMSQT